jgi:hypothetical protein
MVMAGTERPPRLPMTRCLPRYPFAQSDDQKPLADVFQPEHLLKDARTPKAALAKHVPSAAIEQRDAK